MSDRRTVQSFALLACGIWLSIFSSSAAYAQWTAMNPVKNVQQQSDGVTFSMGTGTLKLQVCSESVIHVLYSPTATFPKRPDYVVIKNNWPATKFSIQSNDDAVTVSTSLLKLTITRKDGAIAYAETNGTPLVQEASRTMTPVKVNGEDTYHAESFVNIYGSHEGIYGLGQHQAGVWNYRGRVGGHRTGQQQYFCSPDDVEQGLRHFLEQHVAWAIQQSVRELSLHQLRSRRRDRLLLPLWPRLRQDHRRAIAT